MKTRRIILALMLFGSTLSAATVSFDGTVTNQVIDGFGVNANHRSWNNDELKPVIDALVDQAGMTLFRVVYDDSNWEANNDNSDPSVMNWSYYAPLYSNAEFTKLWSLVAYLNSKGITTNGVIFNFMGPGPAWMGGGSLSAGMESEWAEMITSLLVWARYTNGLQFAYVGPDNEPDISNEGITISSASQYVTALRTLAQELDANNLSDVRLVAPDLAGGGTTYMPEMLADAVVMSKLGHFGVHNYSDGGGSGGVYDYLQASAYPDRTFWMTEFNVWCSTCDSGIRGTYNWSYCKGTAEYLMQHLLNGASGGIVWEGYDSYYLHPPTAWSFWGLFSVDNENAAVKTYTGRKNFYTLAQISKWVRPGAQRIGVSGSVSSLSPLLAFKHSGLGQVTVVGINTSGNPVALKGTLVSLPAVGALDLYYTTWTTNLAYGGSVGVSGGTFSATVPADCVFTLTGWSGLQITITNPPGGSSFNAPATIPIFALAATSTGSIAMVEFFSGSAKLGETTNAPYEFTWTNVPMGNYSLTALAVDTAGNSATSAVVSVSVAGSIAQIGVTPDSAVVTVGGAQQFTATARDVLGHAVSPQPAFSWSVSGGGTIDSNGLFAAGGAVAGPYTIFATTGSFAGLAGVNVVAESGGSIGNPSDGTAADTMWSGGAWINACGFQARSDLMVSTVHAKVAAVSGRYKCAIYADSGGSPDAFLRGTADVANPVDGWSVFTLTSPLALADGRYYWLAIWSDDANARVYYSDTGGTLQWGQYDYGEWPDPIATTGSGSRNYCIYATGPAPVPTPPVIALQPDSQVVNPGSNATFAVSAAGDLPLSYQWYYNSTNALAGSTNNFVLLADVGDAEAGWYSVLVSNAAGAVVSSNAQLVVNHLPVPASPTLPRYWGSGFRAPESVFLGTDPDEDSLFISWVSPLSVWGAAVSVGDGWVIYTPPAGLTNDDAFDYTVTDGRGGFGVGTASVVVLSERGPTLTAMWESEGAGVLRIVGSGIPYRSYTFEFEEAMGAGWQPIGTVMSDASGVFTHVESLLPGVSNRFYRVTTY